MTQAQNDISKSLLSEFEQELATTRRVLERLPEDQLNWRPHEKSMTAGQLALHLAEVPAGVLGMALGDTGTPPDMSVRRQPANRRDILDTLEKGAAFVREALPRLDDARMNSTFSIVQNGKTVMAMPRLAFLRIIMLNHWYQHRGQFLVYLRLIGARIPGSYGPSGDEPM